MPGTCGNLETNRWMDPYYLRNLYCGLPVDEEPSRPRRFRWKTVKMEQIVHGIWTVSRSVMLIGASAYLGVGLILYLMQNRFVFQPSREIDGTPDSAGLSYEDVVFTAEDGVRLTGWYLPATDPRGTVLFCHGNAGNISHRIEMLSILYGIGLNTFIFDYRGYGASEGIPSEEGLYRDAEAAWNWLVETKSTNPANIIVYGRSLGGPVAAHLAGDHAPHGFILESAVSSIPDMADALYPWLPGRSLVRYGFSTVAHLRRVACPILVIHSRTDDLVPYALGRKIFDAAPEPKQFMEIIGGHNRGFIETGQPYRDGLDQFISGLFGSDTPTDSDRSQPEATP